MATWRDWVAAVRLRTLPLAVSAVLYGSLAAAADGRADAGLAVWIALTAAGLQVFANLANDYGDACNGADDAARTGPLRMVAAGRISADAMRRALVWSGAACCVCGLVMLSRAAVPTAHWPWWMLAGGVCLAAAFCYTAGRRPYGYRGWGDVSVFVFFGWVAVCGSAYLQTGRLNGWTGWAAAAMGAWCCMVLNLNNMRDLRGDAAAGKMTLAVRLGGHGARAYHALLASAAAVCWSVWLAHVFSGALWLGLQFLMLAATAAHLFLLRQAASSAALDRLLPQWSAAVLVWTLVSAAAVWFQTA